MAAVHWTVFSTGKRYLRYCDQVVYLGMLLLQNFIVIAY